MNFKHYILTRFNLGLYSDNPYKVPDPDLWLSHRLKLFEKYCLPSVRKQTCKDFTWVMAWDERTPEAILKKYDYLDCVQIVHEQPHVWLRQQRPEAEWLLTTRFDNDDIYLPAFVADVQAAFRFKEEVIDVNYHAWDLYADRYYESGRNRANSPFLSLAEQWNKTPVTALGRPHSVMPDHYYARRLDGVHAIQILHDRNVSNKINGEQI